MGQHNKTLFPLTNISDCSKKRANDNNNRSIQNGHDDVDDDDDKLKVR